MLTATVTERKGRSEVLRLIVAMYGGVVVGGWFNGGKTTVVVVAMVLVRVSH